MRRLFLLILVALIPLRGLAGDLMPITVGTDRGATHTVAMPADCPMQHAAENAGEANQGEPVPVAASCCDICALCFSFTGFASIDLTVAELGRSTRIETGDSAFQSSDPDPALKPPIS